MDLSEEEEELVVGPNEFIYAVGFSYGTNFEDYDPERVMTAEDATEVQVGTQGKVINVGQHQFAVANSAEKLRTYGVYSCVCLVIYSDAEKKAIMAHIDDYTDITSSMRVILSQFKGDNIDKLVAWVIPGSNPEALILAGNVKSELDKELPNENINYANEHIAPEVEFIVGTETDVAMPVPFLYFPMSEKTELCSKNSELVRGVLGEKLFKYAEAKEEMDSEQEESFYHRELVPLYPVSEIKQMPGLRHPITLESDEAIKSYLNALEVLYPDPAKELEGASLERGAKRVNLGRE